METSQWEESAMLIRYIFKRDGSQVLFDREKIRVAVMKAAAAVGSSDPSIGENVTRQVESYLAIFYDHDSIPSVEQIQDLVERILIENDYAEVAKAYILYRRQRARIRDTKELLGGAADLVNRYLDNIDWKVNENSNMSYSLQGLNNYIASEITAQYWLNEIYTPKIRDLHTSGSLHIHDLSNLSVYCCGWDLMDLLTVGFGGVTTKVGSKPARHLRSLLGQIVNFFYTLQGEAAGAQAFANFDTYLAPFVAADKLPYESVVQCIQEFVFNLNVPTRVGFQTPFTNITMDLTAPKALAKLPAIIGGEPIDATYGDFQREMDMINRAFAEVMLGGDASGKVFPFPIPTYNLTSDFNWDNPVLDPVWEMTAKYGIPYFSNFINSDMNPDDARSMCCRLRLDNRELRKRGGGLFGSNPMTGSIGVVTINMPRLGFLSKGTDDLLARLDDLMDTARDSLEIKRKVLERLTDANLYPYSKHYLRSVKKASGHYWNNHFNTIGINGMNECLLNLCGKDLTSREGIKLAASIMNHMKERMRTYQLETGNLYNLEATPAEGVTYRFAKADRDQFGGQVICANHRHMLEDGAEPYYTNSSQLPVGSTDDIFEALEMQDELQTIYTGGTVLHGFLGERVTDGATVRRLVRKIAENYRLPYFTITPTFSICPIHGYIPGEHEYCPICDAELAAQEAACCSCSAGD
ncbi:anaerobic ribonucleoside-triphosphate reductase [Jonquetella anthropi E3_33 E1]|nr:anaerobic ribonucleoside-triphosphate reductase [Jonquetella anthropi E3_33 E1]